MQLNSQSIHRWFDQIAGLTIFYHHLIPAVTQPFQDSRFVLHVSGKLRRFWLVHFRKESVQGQLLVREGDCRQCGTCCNLLFCCPMLTKQSRCSIYSSCRPQACKVFPIDQRDIDEVKLCTPLFPHSPETSFPSDHATLMFAAAFYLLLGRCWAGCGIPLLTVSVLTTWGRVYSGIHFPADIAGSLAVGLMSVGLTRLLAKRIAPLHEKLIRIADQLTDRFGQTKNHGAREC